MSYIGTTKIGKMYLGTTEIAKAYLGTDLVFQAASAPVYTLTVNPSSYDTTNSVYNGWSSNSYTDTKSYTDETSTSCSRARLITGAQAETKMYWKFNLPSLPNGATIKSVSLKAKYLLSNTASGNIASKYLCVCNGTTEVGTRMTTVNTSASTKDINCGSGWTRASIQNLALLFYTKRNNNNTSTNYYQAFYGATLTVEYSV